MSLVKRIYKIAMPFIQEYLNLIDGGKVADEFSSINISAFPINFITLSSLLAQYTKF